MQLRQSQSSQWPKLRIHITIATHVYYYSDVTTIDYNKTELRSYYNMWLTDKISMATNHGIKNINIFFYSDVTIKWQNQGHVHFDCEYLAFGNRLGNRNYCLKQSFKHLLSNRLLELDLWPDINFSKILLSNINGAMTADNPGRFASTCTAIYCINQNFVI